MFEKSMRYAATAAGFLFAFLFLMAPFASSADTADVGDVIPAISCSNGMEATIFVEGLSGPDALAVDDNGDLYVTEESIGQVTKVESNGSVVAFLSGLNSPEGIAFAADGTLYVVEDVVDTGTLKKRATDGIVTTVASNLSSPEGIAISSNGTIYVTASDAEKAANEDGADYLNYASYLYAFAATAPHAQSTLIEAGPAVTIKSFTEVDVDQPSFSGIEIGSDGKIYVASESSGVETTRILNGVTGTFKSNRSVFVFDPSSLPLSQNNLPAFASNLTVPEGIRFQGASQTFPLLAVEEGGLDPSNLAGRLVSIDSMGITTELCSGFDEIEDVLVGSDGAIYVTDDTNGWIIKLAQPKIATETPTATAAQTAIPAATPTGTSMPMETATPEPGSTNTPTAQSTQVWDEEVWLPLIQTE